mgnify:FL=1
MPKTKIVDIENYQKGLRLLEDSASSPIGSARAMTNILISDRNGISKRPGTTLLGSASASTKPTKGFYVYKKAFGALEIPIRSYDTYSEYYHANFGWTRLESGFTLGSEFGFKEHTRNIDNEDYLYMSNKTEDYRRWPGAYTQLNGAVIATATTVTVDGVLKDSIYHSATATGSSTTTVTVASATWVTDQWKNFYVYFPGTGVISLIASNTGTVLTFAAISDPGNVAFQIRLNAIPASGTLIINSEEVAYSAIPTATTITTSALAGGHADNSPVTVKPTKYPGAPKGNRLEVNLDRMLVGNVSSAVSRDGSGNVQGSASPLSVYVSKLRNAADFTFAGTRAAGEGDIISFPEGDTVITDIANQEDRFYVFTKNSITAVAYTQDTNDVAEKVPLKTGTGAIGRVIKGENDIFFVTPDKKISSIGRIVQKDVTPQGENIGLSIKRLTDDFKFDNHAGIKYKQRIFHSMKSSDDATYNDRTLVYNELNKSYEGVWTLGAYGFGVYGDNLYYANSQNPNIAQMFVGTSDLEGTSYFPINSEWLSNWINLTPSKSNLQSVCGWFVEGFLWGGTEEINFSLYKDYSNTASYNFSFGIDNTSFLDNSVGLNGYFGGTPLGVSPIGSLGSIQSDGSRHFSFIIYLPYQYGNFFSLGVQNSELTAKFDITRMGLAVTEEPEYASTRVLTN